MRRARLVKRLLLAAAALWTARWAAGVLAGYAGRHWQKGSLKQT